MILICYWCDNQLNRLDRRFPSISAQCIYCKDVYNITTYCCYNKENIIDMVHLYTDNIHVTMWVPNEKPLLQIVQLN